MIVCQPSAAQQSNPAASPPATETSEAAVLQVESIKLAKQYLNGTIRSPEDYMERLTQLQSQWQRSPKANERIVIVEVDETPRDPSGVSAEPTNPAPASDSSEVALPILSEQQSGLPPLPTARPKPPAPPLPVSRPTPPPPTIKAYSVIAQGVKSDYWVLSSDGVYIPAVLSDNGIPIPDKTKLSGAMTYNDKDPNVSDGFVTVSLDIFKGQTIPELKEGERPASGEQIFKPAAVCSCHETYAEGLLDPILMALDQPECSECSEQRFSSLQRQAASFTTQDEVPLECFYASMNNLPYGGRGQERKIGTYGRCSRNDTISIQQNEPVLYLKPPHCQSSGAKHPPAPCTTEPYAKKISRIYHEVMKCAGLSPLRMFPLYHHESRMTFNRISSTGADCMGQMTPGTVDTVNNYDKIYKEKLEKETNKTEGLISKSIDGHENALSYHFDQPECRQVKMAFEELKGGDDCAILQNPVSCLMYSAMKFKGDLVVAEELTKDGPFKEPQKVAELVAMWSYNGGSKVARSYFKVIMDAFVDEKKKNVTTTDLYERLKLHLAEHYEEGGKARREEVAKFIAEIQSDLDGIEKTVVRVRDEKDHSKEVRQLKPLKNKCSPADASVHSIGV